MEIATADSYHVSIPISLNTRDCGSQKFIRHRTKADELAEQSCQELPLYRAVAINGTPYPASPQYGLRLKVLLRTIKSVAAMGGNPFKDESCPERYAPAGPFAEPSAHQQVEELEFLANACQTIPEQPHLPWHRAWIATMDEIFPPDRMRAWWGETGQDFESYHFPFYAAQIVLGELD